MSTKKEEESTSTKDTLTGCGCLILIIVVLISVIYFFNKDEIDASVNDERRDYLTEDKLLMTSNLTHEKDSISYLVQQCVIFSIEGVDTDAIKYRSRIIDDKLLLLLGVNDMKNIKKSSRYLLIEAVEECLDALDYDAINDRYIGVDGRWNMLLVSTPNKNDWDGSFADEELLFSFYDELGNTITRKSTSNDSTGVNEDKTLKIK